jgi:hypothetical protein
MWSSYWGYGDNLTDKQLILDTWVDTSYLFWLAREASPKEIIVPGLIEVRDHLESNVNFIEFPTHTRFLQEEFATLLFHPIMIDI